MAPKKKTTSAKGVKKAANKKASAKKPTGRTARAQEANQIGFLDLPPELRNDIYAIWAKDVVHVGVRAKGKAHTVAAHPVVNLSHLVNKEFCGVLGQVSTSTAQRVKVQVIDLDFFPLITYLKRVVGNPEADYHDFKVFGGRTLIVELTYTNDFWKAVPTENAAKWFRFHHRAVEGIEYELRTVEVADMARTSEVMQATMSGHRPSRMWVEIVESFRQWSADQQAKAVMQATVAQLMPKPKSAMEQAVDDYYNAIYAEMDANDARRLAAEAEGGEDAKQEIKSEE